MMGNIFSLYF